MKTLFKIFFLIILFSSFGFSAYEWAKNMGGGRGHAVAIDGSGNIFVTGYIEGTSDFDPGSGVANLTSNGWQDIFIAKYDASGNYIWARGIGSDTSIGGLGYDYGYGVAVDGSGNVFVTGSFQSTADFDPGAGTANLTSNGYSDIFIVKYDASGNYLWAHSFGVTSYERGYGVAADGSGNVFVTGYFQSTADFDPSAGVANLTSNGGNDIFIAKYDASGNYLWAHNIGGSSTYDSGKGVVVDASGNVFVTGYFKGSADFDPGAGTATLTSNGEEDIFIAKYDASGNYLWAKSIGATGDDYGNAVAVDGSGNVFVTGYFEGTADFDPGAGTENLSSRGSADIYIAKYDASGNYLWAKSMGGSDNDYGYGVAVDASSNIFVTGGFRATADFNPGSGVANLSSSGNGDIFIARYDASGNYLWAHGMGGGLDYGHGVAVDASGNVVATGFFQEGSLQADFDPGPAVVTLPYNGGNNIFLANYNNLDYCGDIDGNNIACYADGTSCTANNQCQSDTCNACGECGNNILVSCVVDGASCTANSQCQSGNCDACGRCSDCTSDVCDACGECGGNNLVSCLADSSSCTANNQCQSDTCDACGECGSNNPVSCLADSSSCTDNNQCQSDNCDACGECSDCTDACDACGECSGNNPVSCFVDGTSCTESDVCQSDNCDACGICSDCTDACDTCGECSGNNPVSCFVDGTSCTANNQCQSDNCDACGECGGNNPVSCLADSSSCTDNNQCQSDNCDACGECGGNNPVSCLADSSSCTDNNQCQSDNCDLCGTCGSVNSCVPKLSSMTYYSDNILPINSSPLEFTFSISLADTSTRAISVSSSLQNIYMSSVITLKDNNTIEVELNNLQSNDIITVSIDESKIVSADGNYKMSDLLADDSDSSEEGSDEDGSCALDCEGIFEALDADLDVFCAWFTGLGGTGAECFTDCTASFLAGLEETCSSDANDSDATSYTYYVGSLGDYNRSNVLDADDIDTLITYWGSTRYEYELGPCLGGPCLPANLPNLIPAFDGKWNMEDIMSFYIIWNDAVAVADRTLSRSTIDNVGEPVFLYFENNNLVMELPKYDKALHHIWYQIYMPGNDAMYNASDLKEAFDLTLKRESADKSTKEWSLVQLDGISTLDRLVLGSIATHTQKEEIIELQYKITSKDNILSSGSMILEYNPIPTAYALHQAYPNPFNPTTTLSFALPIEAKVSLSIYDLQGREVISLVNGSMKAGYHTAIWNADTFSGGLYFVKMIAGKYINTQKLMLIK